MKRILFTATVAVAGALAAARELRQSAVKQDYERYRMTAHSMKGLMATIGAEEMSAAAKQHEYAARNGVLNGKA